jgi:thiol:disulfide interchange protein DsbD
MQSKRFPLFHSLFALAASMALAGTTHAQVMCSMALAAPANALKAGDRFTAKLTAEIDPGWHIYSLTTPDGGPFRTVIEVPEGQSFKIAGKIAAPSPDVEHSAAFGVDVESYGGSVVFTVPLEAVKPIARGTKVALAITYQACTEENCMLPKTSRVEAVVGPGTVAAK